MPGIGALWTAVGIVTASLVGLVFYVGTRADAVGARVGGLNKVARLGDRLDLLPGRLEELMRHAG